MNDPVCRIIVTGHIMPVLALMWMPKAQNCFFKHENSTFAVQKTTLCAITADSVAAARSWPNGKKTGSARATRHPTELYRHAPGSVCPYTRYSSTFKYI